MQLVRHKTNYGWGNDMTPSVTFLEFEKAVRTLVEKMDNGEDPRGACIIVKGMMNSLMEVRVDRRLRAKIKRNEKRTDGALEG